MFKTKKVSSAKTIIPAVLDKLLSFSRKGSVRNVLWVSFDKVFRLLLSLIVGSAVARYLGPTEWGKINYVVAYISIAATVVTMGLDGFLIKELIAHPEKKSKLLGTAFAMRFVIILVSFVIIIATFRLLELQAQYYLILIFLFFTVVILPFDLIDIENQANLNSKNSTKAKGLAYLLGAGFKILAVILKMPAEAFAFILGFEAVLGSVFLIYRYYKDSGSFESWQLDFASANYIIKNAWPFLLSAVSVILYMRLDQIMLGGLQSVKQVGEFTASVRVTEIFLFLPIAISGSYYSSLLSARKTEFYVLKVQGLFNVMFICSFCIAVAVSIFSNIIIGVLYGREFPGAPEILRIHVWSLVAVFLGVAANQYLVIENLQRLTFYSTFSGLISNIALNIYFIPKWGAKGAAYATIISYTIAAILSNLFFRGSRIVIKYQLQSFLILLKPKAYLVDLKSKL